MMPFGWFLVIVLVMLVAFALAFLFGRMVGREQGYAEGVKEKEDLAQFALDESDRRLALYDQALRNACDDGFMLGMLHRWSGQNQRNKQ